MSPYLPGIMVSEALKAAEALRRGNPARVVNIFTLKPIDREMIENALKRPGHCYG